MSTSTRPTRAEIAEGLGALFVIAVGLVGIPILLATIVGWPLPHHLPTTGQLHSAAGSQIPDAFWPKALAVIPRLAPSCRPPSPQSSPTPSSPGTACGTSR